MRDGYKYKFFFFALCSCIFLYFPVFLFCCGVFFVLLLFKTVLLLTINQDLLLSGCGF